MGRDLPGILASAVLRLAVFLQPRNFFPSPLPPLLSALPAAASAARPSPELLLLLYLALIALDDEGLRVRVLLQHAPDAGVLAAVELGSWSGHALVEGHVRDFHEEHGLLLPLLLLLEHAHYLLLLHILRRHAPRG